MTNLTYLDLQTFIRSKIPDAVVAKKATSIALGIVISRMLPIPSTESDSGESHYSFSVAASAAEIVSTFNENVLVDVNLVLDTARGHWMMRYANTYPNLNASLSSIGRHDFLMKLTGGARYINEDTHCFCEKYSELMVVIINRINRILKKQEA